MYQKFTSWKTQKKHVNQTTTIYIAIELVQLINQNRGENRRYFILTKKAVEIYEIFCSTPFYYKQLLEK